MGSMRLAVIVASLGRRRCVGKLVQLLAAQNRPPDKVIVSIVTPEDGPDAAPLGLDVEVVLSALGSCAQRNRGLDRVGSSADIVVFLDDDFVPASDFLENLERLFADRPDLVGVTGLVLADGVTGPGLDYGEALKIVSSPRPAEAVERPLPNLYGCNMAFRLSAVGATRFDERLPLYGWLEDADFSICVGRNGPMIQSGLVVGVHLGVKAGRTSGVRFGYSQIANPIYLHRKGTMPFRQSASNILRNVATNHLRAIAPEPYLDRRGRVKGNWLAFVDLMRGRLSPERILDL
ncbi:MAG: glycosyltransferase family A protein [Parvularculaceae bacterium]